MTIDQAILKARRTWNRAAHKSRELGSIDAAQELIEAAAIVQALLTPHIPVEQDDDDVEAGFGLDSADPDDDL